MFVAVCRIEVHIPAASSLKDKRSVLRSAMTRVRNEYRVSIAEVSAQAQWDLAVIGMAVVSNEADHARKVLERAVRFLETTRLDADVGAVHFEVLQAL